ncbi:MAG: polysaccharide biosynthesis protein [Bacillota bacterium]|nr:polysaccharide biosynthesis protein [Bacillota bacterium]
MSFLKATLLTSGGTGSFGSAVLDRFLTSNIEEIHIFFRYEKKQNDRRYRNQALYAEHS